MIKDAESCPFDCGEIFPAGTEEEVIKQHVFVNHPKELEEARQLAIGELIRTGHA